MLNVQTRVSLLPIAQPRRDINEFIDGQRLRSQTAEREEGKQQKSQQYETLLTLRPRRIGGHNDLCCHKRVRRVHTRCTHDPLSPVRASRVSGESWFMVPTSPAIPFARLLVR